MSGQKQLENVKYFEYLDSMTTNDARYTYKIKSSIATAKAALSKTIFISPANRT
jgi:hypothetical protein